ncbi:MAG: hypothetical protein IPK66_18785 [Rhodospirillales bacterium]|nr:hypothetical protein [Rhodospirillales bacterium]
MVGGNEATAQAGVESFKQKERIEIILREYESLRLEILERTGHMYQLLVACAAVFLWVLTNSFSLSTLLVILSVIMLGGAFSWLIDRDIRKAAERLRQIEHDINRRVGEDLLVWESRWGGAISGFFGPARPLSKAEAHAWLLKGADPPWVGQLLMFIWRVIRPAIQPLWQGLKLVVTSISNMCGNWRQKIKGLSGKILNR